MRCWESFNFWLSVSFNKIDGTIKLTFNTVNHVVYHFIVVILKFGVSMHFNQNIIQNWNEHVHNDPIDEDVETKEKDWAEHPIGRFELIVTELPCRTKMKMDLFKLSHLKKFYSLISDQFLKFVTFLIVFLLTLKVFLSGKKWL